MNIDREEQSTSSNYNIDDIAECHAIYYSLKPRCNIADNNIKLLNI